ncbi:MAG: molybdenum cofactor biosynthesis protein MoaE [Lysobacter sp.]|nr:molybdenum cofactor biosynthesis protein MoaE [Lysobacter sp.]MDQ3205108.1 molybdenum cofactor biosynthesis protein MoaE [Pseudomonadota bacterium]
MVCRVVCRVVDIADGRLDPQAAIDFVSDDAFGGIDVFIGRVRVASHGRTCVAVHYDMFDPLALTIFERTAAEAIADFGANAKCYIAHAKGRLAVGDLAVVIAFGTPHRDEAFRGCRQIIETVKHQAPIWKQEHFVDGRSEWSEGCSLCGHEHPHVGDPTTTPTTATGDVDHEHDHVHP